VVDVLVGLEGLLRNGVIELLVSGPFSRIVEVPRCFALLFLLCIHRINAIRARIITPAVAAIPSITPRFEDLFDEAERVDEPVNKDVCEGEVVILPCVPLSVVDEAEEDEEVVVVVAFVSFFTV
jgi:hypothetical protein